jgi:hypothetical protein
VNDARLCKYRPPGGHNQSVGFQRGVFVRNGPPHAPYPEMQVAGSVFGIIPTARVKKLVREKGQRWERAR